jgi:hypothetical protein
MSTERFFRENTYSQKDKEQTCHHQFFLPFSSLRGTLDEADDYNRKYLKFEKNSEVGNISKKLKISGRCGNTGYLSFPIVENAICFVV